MIREPEAEPSCSLFCGLGESRTSSLLPWVLLLCKSEEENVWREVSISSGKSYKVDGP